MSDNFWDVILWMFWFMLLLTWIWLIIAIFTDIFRDRELNGGAKAAWTILLIFLPWLGAFLYLIVRGKSMNERSLQAAQENEARMRAYIQSTAGTPSPAEELKKLVELRDAGVITPEDYQQAKAKVLS